MKIRKWVVWTFFLSLLLSCGGDGGLTPDPSGGGTPDPKPWDANRGKVVTPSGTGWTSTTVDEGVIYYTFSGTDTISGKQEEIFVVDLDLSKPQYQVKLLYTAPRVVVSEAFKRDAGTVAAMNANYEVTSIYLRTDGTTRYQISNTLIAGTSVPNWKSEAAFVSDGERNLGIFLAGSPDRIERAAISQLRNYYSSIADSFPYLISSAPMLIDDYEPVGESFCDYSLTDLQVNALNGEDPNRHQRVQHPRSAVALTENNHFILMVVDGRTNSSAGMSARELTRFLATYFNPQYALNMDGGGSSTLCVKGAGDPDTQVVNHPSDGQERPREVHFVILKKS